MANKLLILGAAMAHKNKSYNLSKSIIPAVDKMVKNIGAVAQTIAKTREAAKQRSNKTSNLVNQYLDKLPANPDIELLPEPIANVYYNELNNTKSEIGKLIAERSGPNAANYAPGTEGYMEITTAINKEKKNLNKLLKDAEKFQQINANWFNEHGNISGFWKESNPELYEAMGNILNTENPNYNVTLDENKDWVISTDIDTKNIKVNLDDLDWAQVSMPEIIDINKEVKAAKLSGLQGLELDIADITNLGIKYDSMIGDDESKLYSLMFDELRIANKGGKISMFTDIDFEEDYPNFDENDQSTWPDFQEMKNKTIERLIKISVDENKKSLKSVALDYYNTGTTSEQTRKFNTGASLQSLYEGIMNLKDKSALEIANYVADKSVFANKIGGSNKFTMYPVGGAEKQATNSYNIESEIKDFQKNPEKIYDLLQKLLAKNDSASNIALDIDNFKIKVDKQELNFIGGSLRPTKTD